MDAGSPAPGSGDQRQRPTTQLNQDGALSDLSEDEEDDSKHNRPPVKASNGTSGSLNHRKLSPPTQVFDEDNEHEDEEDHGVMGVRTDTRVQKKNARDNKEDKGVFSQQTLIFYLSLIARFLFDLRLGDRRPHTRTPRFDFYFLTLLFTNIHLSVF